MLGSHPSIDMGQSTEYAKEMRKWEAYPTKYGPAGRPYTFAEYPKRLYKAERVSGKGIQIVEAIDVPDATREQNMRSRGFHVGQDAAIAAIEREHTEHAKLAAEINYEQRRMSPQAQAEAEAAKAEHGARHLPSILEKPIRRRRVRSRWTPKPKAAVAPVAETE